MAYNYYGHEGVNTNLPFEFVHDTIEPIDSTIEAALKWT
jgi:hypothetical protein